MPGASFSVDVGGHAQTGRVLALGGGAAGLQSVMLTDIATAQEWLGLEGRLTRIDLRVPPGEAGGRRAGSGCGRELPPGVNLAAAAQRARTGLDLTQAFNTNLRALGLLALLVGLFLVYGTLSFAIVQRRRTLSVLRALGATRAQLLAIILCEAAALALLGGMLGLAAGLALGHTLVGMVSQTINDLYFVVAVNSVSLPPGEALRALGAALAVALLAAAGPALEAVYSPPQLTLRTSVLERRARRIALGLLALSALLAGACLITVFTSERSVLAGFAALTLAMLSVAAATPAALYGCAVALVRSRLCASPPLRLGLAGIAGSLSRTAVAVAALAIAVAAMIGISIMVDSFRESLRDWLAQTLQADIYVSAPGPGFARPERRLDSQVVSDLVRLPGIAAYSASRRALVQSDRGAWCWMRWIQRMAWAGEDEVLLAQPLAYRLNLGVGSALQLTTPQGPHRFRVAGTFREYGNDRGSARINRALYQRLWQDAAVSALALSLAPGVDSNAMVQRLYTAAAGRQGLQINTPGQIRAISMTIFERTFIVTRVLNWLAAGVAAIGLLSALLAWQLGRTQEQALLRVLGLTRSGAALMILGADALHGRGGAAGGAARRRAHFHPAGAGHQSPRLRLGNPAAPACRAAHRRHRAGAERGPGGRPLSGLARGACAALPGPAGGVAMAGQRRKTLLQAAALLLALDLAGCQRPVTGGQSAAGAGTALPVDRLSVLRAAVQPGFALADGPRRFEFPQDHGPHPQFRHEWWYLTGQLQGRDGAKFGFELTMFRLALRPGQPAVATAGWRTQQLYAAHFAITDVGRARFFSATRYARGAVGLAGAVAEPFDVHVDDWSLTQVQDPLPGLHWQLQAADGDYQLQLQLRSDQSPVLNGAAGWSIKADAPGAASYYYSMPRLEAGGSLTRQGLAAPVSGLAWLDREWGSGSLGADSQGWDWFALDLDDGSALMFYGLRDRNGRRDAHSAGTFLDASGHATMLRNDEVGIEVQRYWNSPRGGRYPAQWRLAVPSLGLQLAVAPLLADQELATQPRYWEGAVRASGVRRGAPVAAAGYVELVGYAQAQASPTSPSASTPPAH